MVQPKSSRSNDPSKLSRVWLLRALSTVVMGRLETFNKALSLHNNSNKRERVANFYSPAKCTKTPPFGTLDLPGIPKGGVYAPERLRARIANALLPVDLRRSRRATGQVGKRAARKGGGRATAIPLSNIAL